MTRDKTRRESGTTRKDCAEHFGILRTYVNFGRPDADTGSVKHGHMYEKPERLHFVGEEYGLFSADSIRLYAGRFLSSTDGVGISFRSVCRGLAEETSVVDVFFMPSSRDKVFRAHAG